MSKTTVYECTNPACSLGTVGQPGRFTSGITPAQVTLLSGKPAEQLDDTEHGDGVCPNCGKRGKAAKA